VFDLRCEVREALVGYLQRRHPDALPRIRVEGFTDIPEEAGPTGLADRPADDTLPVSRPRGRGSSGESESESTHSQGLFTGSIKAIQRARGFTGTGPQEQVDGTPGGPAQRT